MGKNNDYRYFTFPICLLNDAFDNIKMVCDNIMDYAIYKHSLKMELGTEKDRMQAALKYYAIKPGDLKRMTDNGKMLNNSIPERNPLTSINTNMIFDFYKNYKTEFDISCFLAFAAIKSILGKKDYCKTNKELIIARIFGYNSINDLQYSNIKPDRYNKDKTKKYELFLKYSKRYQIDKILNQLQTDWNLRLFSSHCRGFYLSFGLSLEQLAKINIEAKKSTKLNELRNAKKEALKAAKESLKNQ